MTRLVCRDGGDGPLHGPVSLAGQQLEGKAAAMLEGASVEPASGPRRHRVCCSARLPGTPLACSQGLFGPMAGGCPVPPKVLSGHLVSGPGNLGLDAAPVCQCRSRWQSHQPEHQDQWGLAATQGGSARHIPRRARVPARCPRAAPAVSWRRLPLALVYEASHALLWRLRIVYNSCSRGRPAAGRRATAADGWRPAPRALPRSHPVRLAFMTGHLAARRSSARS